MLQCNWESVGGCLDDVTELRSSDNLQEPQFHDNDRCVCLQTDENDDQRSCILSFNPRAVASYSPESSQMNTLNCLVGFAIISQARVVEVHCETAGYCGTSRGSVVEKGDGGVYYKVEFSHDTPITSTVTLKLISFPETNKVLIKHIVVLTQPVTVESTRTNASHQGLNLACVRSLITSTGQPLAPQAEQLLKSVEEYQQLKQV